MRKLLLLVAFSLQSYLQAANYTAFGDSITAGTGASVPAVMESPNAV